MPWITTKSGKRVNTDWFDQEEQISNGEYESKINALKEPNDKKIFTDSKISPLPYDKDKMMEVVFGSWKDKKENFEGEKEIEISKIVATQPYVQANKLKKFKGDVDTSDIKLLHIGDRYYLGDGNHRVVASLLKGKTKIKAKIYRRDK